jgi:hypothetical protein
MPSVYWSPWYPEPLYSTNHLLYETPDSLLADLKPFYNKENKGDNWYQCHAFLNSVKNTFILRFPIGVSFAIHKEFGIVGLDQNDRQMLPFVCIKSPSTINAYTISLLNNWIFWSDEPLLITSTPSYLHKLDFGGHYVPGSFDINSWFRPLEAAIQLDQGTEVFTVKRGDPFAYVKFDTQKPVVLKRFDLTPKIMQISQDCIGYKRHDPSRSLPYLYNKFKSNGLNKMLSREIQKNIMD